MPAIIGQRLPRPDNPQLIQAITASVEMGHPLDTAGKLAGLGHDVAPRWVRWGLEAIEQHPDTDPEELGSYAAFAAAVKLAEARFVDNNLSVVTEAVERKDGKAWLAAMTLLERRRPQDFGRRDRLDVQQQTTSVSVSVSVDSLDAAERVLAQLAQRSGPLQLSAGGGEGADDAPIDIEATGIPPTP